MIQIKQATRSAQAAASITVGSGPDAGFFVNDAVMAAVHFEVRQLAGGVFQVRDLDTVSGTYVGGRAVQEHALQDGDEIIAGVTGTRVKIKGEGEQASLALTVRLNSFAYNRAKEGAFDNDPDRWVQSEQKLSRFPALHVGNRLAMVIAAVGLVAVTLVTSLFETVSDPGPLTTAHATLFEVDPAADRVAAIAGFAAARERVEEQSCDVCHQDGGTPVTACMVCHEDLSAPSTRRHPFHKAPELGALSGMAANGLDGGDGFCVVCHTEHENPSSVKAGSEKLTGDCAACHGLAQGELPVPALPVVATPSTPHSTVRFPHDVHVAAAMDCGLCHALDPAAQALAELRLDAPDREDFAEVPYETCAECHVEGGTPRDAILAQREAWLDKAPKWKVRWHGSEEGSDTCGTCHTANDPAASGGLAGFGPDFVMVDRARGTTPAGTRGLYEVERRSHTEQFAEHAEGKACTECHRAGTNLGTQERPTAAFWHGIHLPGSAILDRENSTPEQQVAASAQCLTCHGDLADATGLVPAPAWWRAESETAAACATCHYEMREGTKVPTALGPSTADLTAEAPASVVQFPHRFHTELEGGCFACHSFAPSNAAGADARVAVLATTNFQAADCTNCHGGHDNVGGGACQQCHPFEQGTRDVYWLAAKLGADPRPDRPALADRTRPWPERNAFSHLSPGHADVKCADCHSAASLDVDNLGAMVAPDESLQLCRDCHLEKQFHWR